MDSRRAITPLLVAVLLVVLWVHAVTPAHSDLAVTWPAAGIATVVFLRMPRDRRLLAGPGLAIACLAALRLGGMDLPSALATSLSVCVGAMLTARILSTEADGLVQDGRSLMRFVVAVLAGAGLSAITLAGVLGALGVSAPLGVVGLRFFGSASAMLLALPLHDALTAPGSRLDHRGFRWGRAEAWSQRTWIVTLALICFLQPWFVAPPLALAIPVLWCALRGGRRETAVQAFAIGALAYVTAAMGLGPASAAVQMGLTPTQVVMLPFAYALLAGAVPIPALLTVLLMHEATTRERQASRTLHRLMNATEDLAIVLTDVGGVVQQINQQGADVVGLAPEDLVGNHVPWFTDEPFDADAHRPDTSGTGDQRRDRLARMAGRRFPDRRLTLPDGTTRWLDVRVVEVTDDDVLLGYLITAADVTERAEIEHTLRRALERETDSLHLLQEADRFKDELVSTISHELRTPITSILGYVEMLGEEIDDTAPDLASLLRPVSRNAHRLHRLVDDLVLLDALEHGVSAPHRRVVHLAEVVAESVCSAADCTPRSVRVVLGPDVATGSAAPVLEANGTHVRRMVDALIDNAVKFSPEGGTVTVDVIAAPTDGTAAEDRPLMAELVVQDQGPGIADIDLPRVFDRFYRSSSAYAEQIQGSGLGLALCKAIAEDHGGTVSLVSLPDGGTRASCLLPIARTASGAAGAVSDTGDRASLRRRRSLIVSQRSAGDEDRPGASVA